MAPQVAWIGLGNIGRGICKNIVAKANLDKSLILYNRTTQRASDLSQALGTDRTAVASTIEEVVSKADVIFTCVGDDAAIQATIDEALKYDVKGKLFVDSSTVAPETSEDLGQKITAAGAEFVASPVFGAPAMADAGSLISVPAGPKESVDKALPYMQGVTSKAVINFSGEAWGKACLLKLVGNTMIMAMVESLAESHVMAEKTGLGVANLHKWIEMMFPGPYAAYSNRMQTGDYKREKPLFAVDLALKDVRHALKLADDSGAKMGALEVAQQHLKEVKEERGENGDIAGIYGAVRKESGLEY